MRVALIPVQEALQKTVLLKAHKDHSATEFQEALDEAIKSAQAALVWLYSNNTSGYKREPNSEKQFKKIIIPRDGDEDK